MLNWILNLYIKPVSQFSKKKLEALKNMAHLYNLKSYGQITLSSESSCQPLNHLGQVKADPIGQNVFCHRVSMTPSIGHSCPLSLTKVDR